MQEFELQLGGIEATVTVSIKTHYTVTSNTLSVDFFFSGLCDIRGSATLMCAL